MQTQPSGGFDRIAAVRLFGYSFLILFLELALIRYVPGHVRVFGFFLNFVLIATFLGMGVGLLRARQADRLRWLGVPALLLLFAAVRYFSNVIVEPPPRGNEYLWGVFFDVAPSVQRMGIVPVAILLFGLCALVFVPLGALLGQQFRKFPPLHAYSIDIAGSLLGIFAFGGTSALGTPPLVWFALGCAVWIVLSVQSRGYAAVATGTSAVVLGLVVWTSGPQPEYWSPYYRINVFFREGVYNLDVNGSFHQRMLALDSATAAQDPALSAVRNDYLRPLRLLGRPDTVLVLGAGTGNDVALFLEAGAQHIDAVEIDPVILAIGEAGHLQRPYDDPRVHVHVDDARAFLKRTKRRYDVIALGTLDSQTLLSGVSSLRLDNYVYTVEAFASGRDHLTPGGHLITYHMSPSLSIAKKIHDAIAVAFGEPPVVLYEPDFRLFNYTFVAGPGVAPEAGTGLPAGGDELELTLQRDDWPYLYLRSRTIPAHYLWALLGVLGVATLMVGWAAGRELRGGFDGAMFCMGTGFLLIETKSVTEMSLLFGSTWTVNLLVFSSILVMILFANLIVLRRPPRSVRPLFAALFAAIALAFAVPVRSMLHMTVVGQWLVGGLLVALPIFFAAMIFATLFRTRADSTRALGYNLLGAIAGGVLEYSSMVLGVKALYLLVAAAYVGAYLFATRRSDAAEPAGAAQPLAVGAAQ
jgi:hypothetical protein